MAEDEPHTEEPNDNEDEAQDKSEQIQGGQKATGGRRHHRPTKQKCNIRIEELAKPKKWLMLGTWREFHTVFDPERLQRFKEKVQEEFSMSPEETELYFSQLKKHVGKMRSKKALERQMKREKAIAKQEAYSLFRKRLGKALRFAFEHQPPAIVSPLLRDLSDCILQKLADIHRVNVPRRDDADKMSVFLICVADWAAKLVSNIYYEVDAYERADKDNFLKDAPSSKVSVCHTTSSEEIGDDEDEEEEEEELGKGEGEGETPYRKKFAPGEPSKAETEEEGEAGGKEAETGGKKDEGAADQAKNGPEDDNLGNYE